MNVNKLSEMSVLIGRDSRAISPKRDVAIVLTVKC